MVIFPDTNTLVSSANSTNFELETFKGKSFMYEGNLENKERFAIKRYLLII